MYVVKEDQFCFKANICKLAGMQHNMHIKAVSPKSMTNNCDLNTAENNNGHHFVHNHAVPRGDTVRNL